MRGGATRTFWILTAMAVVFLILFLAISATMWNRVASMEREAQAARQKRDALKAEVEGVSKDELLRRNGELDARLGQLERDLPQPAYVPTLLRQLEREAALTYNDVTEIRPGELRRGQVVGSPAGGAETTPAAAGAEGETEQEPQAAGGQRYDELDITLRMRGSFHTAFDLLKRMGALRKMLYVKSISAQRAGREIRPHDGRAEIELDLEVAAYILEPHGGFPGQLTGTVFP